MQQPRIVTLKEKKLIGKRLRMSLANNKTFDLWRSFMPQRGSVQNKASGELISMRVYDGPLSMELHQEFDKWAAIEVSEFSHVPNGMESFILNEGLYAVFDYKGLNNDNRIFIYIFTEWLPDSGYMLDERPHFEILGEKYRNNDPESEEEIWIPVRPKLSN
jgi:AraC family transcriptional regulator